MAMAASPPSAGATPAEAAIAIASAESLASSVVCARGARSPASARGRRSPPIQLCALLASMTASVFAPSSPRRRASARASAAPARLMAASRLLTSLVRAPSPTRSPMRTRRCASVRSSASWRANTASAQATIRLIVPSSARAGPPLIGASITARPAACSRAAQRSTSSGAIVGHSTTVAPARAPLAMPSAPKSTASVCAASTTATMTRSQARASAAGVAATWAPAASASRSGRMSRTHTAWPVASRRRAMPSPMLPTPTTPIVAAASFMTASGRGCAQSTSGCPGPGPASPSPCRHS